LIERVSQREIESLKISKNWVLFNKDVKFRKI